MMYCEIMHRISLKIYRRVDIMKKILAIMLALVMLLTLAACGGNKDNNGDETPSGNDVEQTTEPTTEAKDVEKEIVEKETGFKLLTIVKLDVIDGKVVIEKTIED